MSATNRTRRKKRTSSRGLISKRTPRESLNISGHPSTMSMSKICTTPHNQIKQKAKTRQPIHQSATYSCSTSIRNMRDSRALRATLHAPPCARTLARTSSTIRVRLHQNRAPNRVFGRTNHVFSREFQWLIVTATYRTPPYVCYPYYIPGTWY